MSVRHVSIAFADERGSIADILEDEPIEHVSVIHTRRGAVRGNHYHRETHQWVYVIEGALRCLTRDANGREVQAVARAGDVYYSGPYDAHAIEALEDSVMVVMTRGPRGGREYESDTFRLVEPLLREATPA
jgi:oxalate decarboxylase/phosphoglucose isomerase-like protein (cupin superfamily)